MEELDSIEEALLHGPVGSRSGPLLPPDAVAHLEAAPDVAHGLDLDW